MVERVNTTSVSRNVAETDDIVLDQTATTRIVFHPVLNPKGVDGVLMRQKRKDDKNWADAGGLDFRKAEAGAFTSIRLSSDSMKLLYDRLACLYAVQQHGIRNGERHLVVNDADDLVVTDKNKARVIRQIIDHGNSEEFWQTLEESQSDLASRLAESKIHRDRVTVIQEFRSALSQQEDEGYWQSLFQKNPWILEAAFALNAFQIQGETYLGGKNSKGRNGRGGIASDFLFRDGSTQSFALVEIKKPSTQLMAKEPYRGNKGTNDVDVVYSAAPELSGGMVQLRTQISQGVQGYDSPIEHDFDGLNRVHPSGILVIGKYADLESEQQRSFDFFRHGLSGISIICFDELLNRLSQLYESPQEPENPEPDCSTEPNEWY